MKKVYQTLLWMVVLSLLAGGCGTTKRVVEKVTPGGPGLKKRIMVLPLIDYAGIGPETHDRLTHDFIALLSESNRLIISRPPRTAALPEGNPSPQLGAALLPSELLELARQMGINAIVYGVLLPVESATEKGGIWPFRSYRMRYEMVTIFNVGETRCGTLLLTNREAESETLSMEEAEAQDPKQIKRMLLDQTVDELLERQSSKIMDGLSDAPWYGRILSIEGDTIKINAGKDVGVQEGDVFTVFSKGDTVTCVDGRTLELLGTSPGRIRVTEVRETHALAEPLNEGGFVTGQVVRYGS